MLKFKNQIVGFCLFFKISIYFKLIFEYYYLQEFCCGGNLLNCLFYEVDIVEQIQYFINGGGLKFDYFVLNEKYCLIVYILVQYMDCDSYYGSKKDQNVYGKIMDLIFIGGF